MSTGAQPLRRSTNRRVLARTVIAIGLVALGIAAAVRLPLRTFPEPRYPTLSVYLQLPAALDPEEVARRWVIPLEGELRELGGVLRIVGQVGSSDASLTAELEPGTDVETKAARLAGPLEGLRRSLPDRGSLIVDSASRTSGHVTAVVWISGARADSATIAAAERLAGRPGINSVTRLGTWERWTRIAVRSRGSGARDLGGRVEATLEDRLELHRLGTTVVGGREVPVLLGSFEEPVLGDLPIATDDGVVPLSTVADVQTRRVPPRTLVHFDGEPSRGLLIRREPSTSPLRADAEVRSVLQSLGEGARPFVSWSEADPLRDLLTRAGSALLLASLLLAIAGFARAGRAGLWAGLAPILALAAALNALWLAGLPADTVNSTALEFGLVVCFPLALLRPTVSRVRILAAGGLLAFLALLVPFVLDLGGGALRWSLAEPGLSFALSAAAGFLALFVLPRAPARRRDSTPSPGVALLRRALRDPATFLLIGFTLTLGLVVAAGPALEPQRRAVPRNPADLTIHLALPAGGTQMEAEWEAEPVERFLSSQPTVVRHWSVIQDRDAFVFVELDPSGRRLEGRRRLEAELRASVVTSATIDVSDGAGSAGGAATGGTIERERLTPDVDATDHTFYRFLLRSADLGSLREANRRVALRIGDFGVEGSKIVGWDRPQLQIRLRPRESADPRRWIAWIPALERETSAPRPLTLSRAEDRYVAVHTGPAPVWEPFDPPRLSQILDVGSAVETGTTGSELFRVEELLIHPRVVRENGTFVVPITIRPRLVSESRREERIADIDAALRDLPMPVGASVSLPDLGGVVVGSGPRTGWRLGILAALVVLTVAAVWAGSFLVAVLASATAALAVLTPAPWIAVTLGRADELTVLALAALGVLIAARAIDLATAPRRNAAAGTPTAVYRVFRERIGADTAGSCVAVVALVPLLATTEPLRTAWAVPAATLAIGIFAGTVALHLLLPASLVAVHRARSWSMAEARDQRRPVAWAAPSGPPRLEVRNLVKRYPGGHFALRGVSFALEPGVVGLLGPNGAGKTTLLRILVGLLKPTRGHVRYRGVPIDPRNQALYRSKIGFLPQELNAYAGVTGEQFLDLWALEKGMTSPEERNREVERVLELVELAEHGDRKVRSYSGGMRRRVGIAQALLGDPSLLVVDEPTAGMDLQSRLQLRRILRRVSEDRIVLISTHLTGDVDALGTRLLMLSQGRLRYDGTQSGFLASSRGRVVELVVPPGEVEEIASRHRVTRRVHVLEGVEMRLVVGDEFDKSATTVEPTLEEAYLMHLDE